MSSLRYPGSKPFEANQKDIFFGRKTHIEEIYRRISLEPFTILFSKSGLGKSSLINAGLIPKISLENKYKPIYIRFLPNESEELSPVEKTGLRIRSGKKNIATYLDKLIKDEDTLWHDLKEHQINSKENQSIVLIFDQFEEFFTYSPEDQLEFRKQLSESLNTPTPQRYWDILELYNKDNTPFNKEELALLQKNLNLKVLISIREDRLHLLENMSDYLPTNSTNWYKLGPLDDSSAKDAIELPAKIEEGFASNSFNYSPKALEHILKFLNKEHTKQIESSQLQIICSSIEEKVIDSNLSTIKLKDVDDLNSIIGNYYEQRINAITDLDQRKKAKDVIEDELIFEDGEQKRRLAIFEGKILQKINKDTLKNLVDSHLLRSVPLEKGGFTYELSHDVLLEPISVSKRFKAIKRKEEELKEASMKIAKQRKQIFFYAILAAIAIVSTIYGISKARIAEVASEVAKDAEKKADQIKVDNILNFAQSSLNDDPTISFRIAEAALERHGNSKEITKTLISAYNSSNTIQFYDSFYGHTDEINSIELNNNEDMVVTASDDYKAFVWNLNERVIIDSLIGHKGRVNHAIFSNSGDYVITASDDHTARIWDYKTEKNNFIVLKGHTDKINYVSVSPNDKYIVTAGDDYKAYVWDFKGNKIDSLETNDPVTEHEGEILWTKFDSEGDYVFTYTEDKDIRKWKIDSTGTFRYNSRRYNTKGGNHPLPFNRSPLNKHLITIHKSKIILHDDDQKGFHSGLITLKENYDLITTCISEDKTMIVSADANNQIILSTEFEYTDISNKLIKAKSKVIGSHEGKVYSIVFSPNGEYFATTSEDQTIKLWDRTGTNIQTLRGFKGHSTKIKFSRNDEFLLTASGQDFKYWPFTKNKIKVLTEHTKKVNSAQFSKENDTILTASDDGRSLLWHIESNTYLPIPHTSAVSSAQFIPTIKSKERRYGKLLLTTSGSKAFIWDYKTYPFEDKKINYDDHNSKISNASPFFDGSYIVTGDTEGEIYLWDNHDRIYGDNDPKHYNLAKIIKPRKTVITDVKYLGKDGHKIIISFDSKRFNSAYITNRSLTKPILSLDSLDSRALVKLSGHKEKINSIILSDDGAKIATASDDNTTIIWSVEGKQLGILRGHTDDVLNADFSKDGEYIVTCSKDKTIKIWDISQEDDYYELFSYKEHLGPVNSVEFSKNNDYILSASDDMTVRIKPINFDIQSIIDNIKSLDIKELTKDEKKKYGIKEKS